MALPGFSHRGSQRRFTLRVFILFVAIAFHAYLLQLIFSSQKDALPEPQESRVMLLTLLPALPVHTEGVLVLVGKKIIGGNNPPLRQTIRSIPQAYQQSADTHALAAPQPQSLPIELSEHVVPAGPTILEQAKRDIAKIDKEMRGKAPPVPLDKPKTGFLKLAQDIEQAYVGANSNDSRMYYESPEGVFYFKETIKGQTICQMTGAPTAPSGKDGGAMRIQCPASGDWKKY